MEAPEEVAMTSKDHTNNSNIIKGKRTKRLRPHSPIPSAITSQNSMYKGNHDHDQDHDDHDHVGKLIPNISSSSSLEYQDKTEEEEDMANCLILLARGQSRESAKQEFDHDTGVYNKFTSRKFMEAATNGATKAGYYVYECKTCNRTFPSFQALGGHRASHKKPKAAAIGAAALVEEKIRQFTAAAAAVVSSSDEEEGQFIKTNNLSSLSLQFGNNNNNQRGLYSNNNNVINKAKVHECSICGAEFTSGQALGGHMRRHRGPMGGNTSTATTTTTTTVAANTALSLTVPMSIEADNFHRQPKKNVLSLDLDLNLPAPEEDHRESKFPFASKQEQKQQQQQQQSPLVFSAAPTLVDCHY